MHTLRRISISAWLAVAIAQLLAVVTILPARAAIDTEAPTQELVTTVKVKVGDNYFKPKSVTITVGDKVTWQWIGTAIHDVKATKGPQKFVSKKQASGKFSKVLLEPGKYKIVCTLHPGMDMKLGVKPPPPPPVTSLP